LDATRIAHGYLGVFVSVLAAVSFLIGIIISFMGLRGVRERELN
jgi:hypothetical protein